MTDPQGFKDTRPLDPTERMDSMWVAYDRTFKAEGWERGYEEDQDWKP